MSRDAEYLAAINNLINEIEKKLREDVKDKKHGNGVEKLKTLLKYVMKKQKQLIDKHQKSKI